MIHNKASELPDAALPYKTSFFATFSLWKVSLRINITVNNKFLFF